MTRRVAIVVTCVFGAAILVAVGIYLYTPTITINVYNDTGSQVTVATCTPDPATIGPGQSTAANPLPNDRHAACTVYAGDTRADLGCLPIPTTRYRGGDTVDLTKMIRGVPPEKCGD